ncbi:MAG: hypothetical protein AABY22_36895, partial [Nanoarchaeota archaeon]
MENLAYQELSKYIIASKYARYDGKLKRRETWDEAISRVERMHLEKYSFLSEVDKNKIKSSFELVKKKIVMPSMRSVNFAGRAVEAKNPRMYNCSFRHIDSIRAISESFFL